MSTKERWSLPWSLDEQGVVRDNKGGVVEFQKDQLKLIVDFVNYYAFDERYSYALIVNDGFTTLCTIHDGGPACDSKACMGYMVKISIKANKQARKEYDEKLAKRHRETTEK